MPENLTRKKLMKSNSTMQGATTLYLEGEDRIVTVVSTGYDESIARMFFEDIRYIVVFRRNDYVLFIAWLLFSLLWGGFLLIAISEESVLWSLILGGTALFCLTLGINQAFVRKRSTIQFRGVGNSVMAVEKNVARKKLERILAPLRHHIRSHQASLGLDKEWAAEEAAASQSAAARQLRASDPFEMKAQPPPPPPPPLPGPAVAPEPDEPGPQQNPM